MSDASSIGRRSRRKGKRFECQVARLLTEVSGVEWATSRNSGRTDIAGDVYRVADPTAGPIVECKHRQTWTMKQFVKRNKVYMTQLTSVQQVLRRTEISSLVVIAKDDVGVWISRFELVGVSILPVGVAIARPRIQAHAFDPQWYLVDLLDTEVYRGFFAE